MVKSALTLGRNETIRGHRELNQYPYIKVTLKDSCLKKSPRSLHSHYILPALLTRVVNYLHFIGWSLHWKTTQEIQFPAVDDVTFSGCKTYFPYSRQTSVSFLTKFMIIENEYSLSFANFGHFWPFFIRFWIRYGNVCLYQFVDNHKSLFAASYISCTLKTVSILSCRIS